MHTEDKGLLLIIVLFGSILVGVCAGILAMEIDNA